MSIYRARLRNTSNALKDCIIFFKFSISEVTEHRQSILLPRPRLFAVASYDFTSQLLLHFLLQIENLKIMQSLRVHNLCLILASASQELFTSASALASLFSSLINNLTSLNQPRITDRPRSGMVYNFEGVCLSLCLSVRRLLSEALSYRKFFSAHPVYVT